MGASGLTLPLVATMLGWSESAVWQAVFFGLIPGAIEDGVAVFDAYLLADWLAKREEVRQTLQVDEDIELASLACALDGAMQGAQRH